MAANVAPYDSRMPVEPGSVCARWRGTGQRFFGAEHLGPSHRRELAFETATQMGVCSSFAASRAGCASSFRNVAREIFPPPPPRAKPKRVRIKATMGAPSQLGRSNRTGHVCMTLWLSRRTRVACLLWLPGGSAVIVGRGASANDNGRASHALWANSPEIAPFVVMLPSV
jgi:hypothetical protein